MEKEIEKKEKVWETEIRCQGCLCSLCDDIGCPIPCKAKYFCEFVVKNCEYFIKKEELSN